MNHTKSFRGNIAVGGVKINTTKLESKPLFHQWHKQKQECMNVQKEMTGYLGFCS